MAEKERFEESTGAVEQSQMINIRHIVYRIINTYMVKNYIVYCSVPSADAVVWVSLWVKIRDYLSIGLLNDGRTELYQRLAAGQCEEEYIPNPSGSAEEMFFRVAAEDAARDAYASLTYREQRIVAQRLVFCSECLSTVTMDGGERVQKQTFLDIALSHGLSSAVAAEKIYRAALRRMRSPMEKA